MVQFSVEKLSAAQWAPLSENAHLIAFKEKRPWSLERIDFALLVKSPATLVGYVTCREHNAESLYWQYGGAFPGTKQTSLSYPAYAVLAEYCKKRYKRVTTCIENTNLVMLKMAMKVGFRIVGTRAVYGSVLVELLMEGVDADA